MQAPNRASLNEKDIMPATVVLVLGQYNKIGEHVIAAGLYKSIGLGSSSSYSDAPGRMYAKLQTATPTEITGRLRISVFSPQDRPMYVIGEWPTSALDQNSTDRTKWVPLPNSQYKIGKDFKFVFEFKPDAAGTITQANSVIQIDTTEMLIN